jgi:putative transposase
MHREVSRQVFKFRLYPDQNQERKMFRFVETCRRLWNDALAHRKTRWEENHESTSYKLQQWILTGVRHSDPELAELYSQSAQNILHRLDLAYQAFFKGITKRPRFHKFSNEGSFTYPQAYNGSVKLNGGTITLAKVGEVPIIIHREVPESGRLDICTIRKEACGEWYAVLTYETTDPLPVPKEEFNSPLGIDLGLKAIITTTEGQTVEPPHFYRKSQKRLRRLQRQLARRQKGSKNREKARQLVAIQHAKVRRQREHFNNILSCRIVRDHDLVVMEDLHIRNMVKNHALAKSISDAGWGQLKQMIDYKEKRVGGRMISVDPAGTTSECFFCGMKNNIGLDVREFDCIGCGRHLHRDFHASWKILREGLSQVGQGMPEHTPVEMAVLPTQPNWATGAIVEAGIEAPTFRSGI